MTTKDMVAIILRLFGVFSLFLAVTLLSQPYLVLIMSQRLPRGVLAIIALSFLPSLVFVAIAVALFLYPNQLAMKIVPTHLHDERITQLQPREIQSVLFSFAGLFMVGIAILPITQRLTELIRPSIEMSSRGLRESWWGLLPGVLVIVFGLLLFFRTKGFVSFWERLSDREDGHATDSKAEEKGKP
jgi:hypothetical protein